MSVDGYLEEAEKWLAPRESRLLRQIAADGLAMANGVPSSLDNLVSFEAQLRTDVGNWRKAEREGNEYRPLLFESRVLEGTPMEVEKRLMKLRWDSIEGMETDHHFDVEWLILFLCKLSIQHRLHAFDVEAGRSVFRTRADGKVMP